MDLKLPCKIPHQQSPWSKAPTFAQSLHQIVCLTQKIHQCEHNPTEIYFKYHSLPRFWNKKRLFKKKKLHPEKLSELRVLHSAPYSNAPNAPGSAAARSPPTASTAGQLGKLGQRQAGARAVAVPRRVRQNSVKMLLTATLDTKTNQHKTKKHIKFIKYHNLRHIYMKFHRLRIEKPFIAFHNIGKKAQSSRQGALTTDGAELLFTKLGGLRWETKKTKTF